MSIDSNQTHDTNSQIQELIKRTREERDLSQRKAAPIFGVTNNAIARWDAGIGYPDTDTLIMIMLEAKTSWARTLARKCLHLRYPKVFSNGN